MAHTFKLGKQILTDLDGLRGAIQDLYSDLEGCASGLSMEADEHRDAYSERSDSWQEGERGAAVETWLDRLDELATALSDAAEALGNVDLDDLPATPDY